ncbi:adenylyl cyclase 78C-like, partial [Sitodiplosis mosellana]|uniref:adenylyl cyclase 78C-like n=1 Tax=Sitodiplosis mosellana TaxID=263140 RepID=UPI002444A683
MHNLCGVMFASIPNFQDFYSEDIENGKACIRILNEIICDFDSLMDEPQFSTVEKIKTVGATYMAAAGLNPKHQLEKGGKEEDCVCDLVEFAMTLCQKLQEVNKDAFNTFQLRVGISSGSLVSGVIGARKPVYDIWGNTVNVASRMDSTGENWKIQVPDYTAQMLISKGYTCVGKYEVPTHKWDFFISPLAWKDQLKSTLAKNFKMKDLGTASNVLGIHIDYDYRNGVIKLDQRKYTEAILRRFNMCDCDTVKLPKSPSERLTKDMSPTTEDEIRKMSNVPYQEAVGSILCLQQYTRPDISFCVAVVSQFNQQP